MIYTYHFFLEKSPQKSKEVERLQGILKLIYSCKSRVANELDFCKSIYGTNPATGKILGTESNLKKIEKYRNIEKRLKSYYNNTVDKLTKF